MNSMLMRQHCSIHELPYTGQTETIQIADALICSQPFPMNSENWSDATDFEGVEIFAAKQDDVQKGHVLTTQNREYVIHRVKRYNYGYGTRGFLHLLMRDRN